MNQEQQKLLEAWLKSVGFWYYVFLGVDNDELVIYKWSDELKRKVDLCTINMKDFRK